MTWNSTSEFFAMGGYALYVWGSFGVAAILLTAELLIVRARRRSALVELRREILARRGEDR
jgi:heme exporter protein D